MILISHRGNVSGKTEEENNPDYINSALKNFDCEVDVWHYDGWYLGHDKPEHEIEESFLRQEGLWCHAKTEWTLYSLMGLGVRCFFHNTDAVTLTSDGYLWTYPGRTLTPSSICVLPEMRGITKTIMRPCAGFCSDRIGEYV